MSASRSGRSRSEVTEDEKRARLFAEQTRGREGDWDGQTRALSSSSRYSTSTRASSRRPPHPDSPRPICDELRPLDSISNVESLTSSSRTASRSRSHASSLHPTSLYHSRSHSHSKSKSSSSRSGSGSAGRRSQCTSQTSLGGRELYPSYHSYPPYDQFSAAAATDDEKNTLTAGGDYDKAERAREKAMFKQWAKERPLSGFGGDVSVIEMRAHMNLVRCAPIAEVWEGV